MQQKFRDPADRPQASSWDPAADDVLEDEVLEMIARRAVTLPLGMQRAYFDRCVASLLVELLSEASKSKTMRRLFDDASPSTADMETVTRIVAELIDSDNPRLQSKCLAFVLGLNLHGGRSETEIAHEEGVTKATVSKRCIVLRETFGLPPSRGMKTDAARASYRLRQTGVRARPPRMEWGWRGILSAIFQPA